MDGLFDWKSNILKHILIKKIKINKINNISLHSKLGHNDKKKLTTEFSIIILEKTFNHPLSHIIIDKEYQFMFFDKEKLMILNIINDLFFL